MAFIGTFIGSGAALRKLGPFLFYYIVFPLMSALAFALFMSTIHIPGLTFDISQVVPSVAGRQGKLALAAGGGIAIGAIGNWVYRRMFLKRDRRRPEFKPLIDPHISMERRKHLAMLQIDNSAGPREIMAAWRTLSKDLERKRWGPQRLRRSSDITPEVRKRKIDEAYQWLSQNPRED